jgi:DNA (cytosine-5)-methyltransferase 1
VNEPHYYNEFDADMADWLRDLMSEGLIPQGDVDERSIVDVQPTDLRGYVQCHFFAGISGWPLALRLAGVPASRRLWTGSCPCQPFSCAGKRRGTMDSRHLWPVWVRLIAECNGLYGVPTVFGEQVASADGRLWLAGVRASLENLAYAVGAADLCSAGVGAPNIRQRLFWVADHDSERCSRREKPNERENQSKQPASRRGDAMRCSWMGEPIQPGLEGHAGNGDDRHEPGRNGAHATGPTAAASESGGVEQSTRNGREQRGTEPGGRGATERCEQGGMAVTNGRQSSNGELQSGGQHGLDATGRNDNGSAVTPEREENFWSDAIWHLCRDGKQRRIPLEPVLQRVVAGLPEGMDLCGAENGFPLSKKIPKRVALLKGYGNAINAHVAAQFIKASLNL